MSKLEQASGTSPESIYLLFLLSIARAWFEHMVNLDKAGCERSVMAFMALAVPEADRRDALINLYKEHKNKRDGDEISASMVIMGIIIGSITETMGLTNKDYVDVF
jgi:hypothetical protein